MSEYFRQKIKKLTLQALAKAGWAIFTTLVVITAAGTTIWLMAAFTEPSVGPASSDQDFAQNVMGANNANNDFDSSSVAANADGSIIERIEYLIDYLVNGGAVCGNGVVEIGEGCDDGGTSWTSGACAGDCSRTNYWSDPAIYGSGLATDDIAAIYWCNDHGYNSFTSAITSLLTSSACGLTTTGTVYTCYDNRTNYYGMYPGLSYTSTYTSYVNEFSVSNTSGRFGSYISVTLVTKGSYYTTGTQSWLCVQNGCKGYDKKSWYYTKEIWCAD